jgi:hypothetical protein
MLKMKATTVSSATCVALVAAAPTPQTYNKAATGAKAGSLPGVKYVDGQQINQTSLTALKGPCDGT